MRGPLSGQTGRWGGEGFEGTLVWRCNQADCCRAAKKNTPPQPPSPALPPLLSDTPLCPFTTIVEHPSEALWVLFEQQEASGQALGTMRRVSRQVLPVRQSQVASPGASLSDKALIETPGICCKFSTLDRKINRDYL